MEKKRVQIKKKEEKVAEKPKRKTATTKTKKESAPIEVTTPVTPVRKRASTKKVEGSDADSISKAPRKPRVKKETPTTPQA